MMSMNFPGSIGAWRAALVVAVLIAGEAVATDRFVAPKGNDAGNDCSSAATPCATVSRAIAVAGAGPDEIKVALGTYRTDDRMTVDYPATLTVTGGWLPGFSARDPQKRSKINSFQMNIRSVSAPATDVTLDGLELVMTGTPVPISENAIVTLAGDSPSLTIRRCVLRGRSVTDTGLRGFELQPGNVVVPLQGTPTIRLEDSRILRYADVRLSIAGSDSATVTVDGCSFERAGLGLDTSGSTSTTISVDGSSFDRQWLGGGLGFAAFGSSSLVANVTDGLFQRLYQPLSFTNASTQSASLTIERSTFTKNFGAALAAPAAASLTDVTIRSSRFVGNRSGFIGGGFVFMGDYLSGPHPCQLLIENTAFIGNKVVQSIGPVAIFCEPFDGTIRNSTIVNNRVSPGDGGIRVIQRIHQPQVLNLTNTVSWGNSAAGPGLAVLVDSQEPNNADAVTVNVDHSDVGDIVGPPGWSPNLLAGNINANPLVVKKTKDAHLSLGSPCIDVGSCAGAPATDFDGDPRPGGAGCDIGADEVP
jgi:hypothetical protein